MATIACAFCKSKGKDPFRLLSRFSTCEVCNGIGMVRVNEPVVKCAFCKGTGVHPHSRITCVVCKGKGSITQRGNKEGFIRKGVEAYGKYSG